MAQILLLDLSLQINTIQEDIQFIKNGLPGFNIQIGKKDIAFHFLSSALIILWESK